MASLAPRHDPEERNLNVPLMIGIFLMPYIFVWFLLRKEHGARERLLGFGWLAVIVIVAMVSNRDAPAARPTPARAAEVSKPPAVANPVAAKSTLASSKPDATTDDASPDLARAKAIVKQQFFPDEVDRSDSASYQKQWWMVRGAVHQAGYPCAAVAFVKQTFHGTFQAICKVLPHSDKYMVFEINPDEQTVVPIG